MSEQWQLDLPLKKAFAWGAGAVACFHLAYEFDFLRGLIVGFLFCLVPLARLSTSLKAFWTGVGIGFAIYAPQLLFFWTIFGARALGLWFVLAFWLGVFVLLSLQAIRHFGRVGLIAVPVLWMGLEYFRSEMYYLRFSWLAPGYVFSGTRLADTLGVIGVYGIGALLITIAVAAWSLRPGRRAVWVAVAIVLCSLLGTSPGTPTPRAGQRVEVAGVQLEFPDEQEVLAALNRVASLQTNASLFVMSEYTFKTPIPDSVLAWCREKRKFLIAGGQDPAADDYFNTAFVIGPDGNILFKQAKSVPVQFFNDGLPAREQRLWTSPWGRIGMAVCYDLSYRQVMDRLIAQGCQALIIPTMDAIDWGDRQHRLHGRVAPMRAAEYGLPVFRLCSSGISQAIEPGGLITATAPYPGKGAVLAATIVASQVGRLPIDHWLGPAAVGVTGLLVLVFLAGKLRRKGHKLSTGKLDTNTPAG